MNLRRLPESIWQRESQMEGTQNAETDRSPRALSCSYSRALDQWLPSSCVDIESHSCFLETLTILSIHGNSAQLISGYANGPALVQLILTLHDFTSWL